MSNGRIITFYSYKGGTGRTMAAANMAWVLASNGYRVLLIDWDLESPGLHRYLRPFLADPDLTGTPGLIEFAEESRLARSEKPPGLLKYVVPVEWTFSMNGSIDFLGAGRQDESYQRRVNSFNWSEFYDRHDGNRLLAAERARLKENYDYVLIDSRTGIGDTAGICTVQMPDMLVVLFTLNHQSIEGSVAMAASIQAQRVGMPIFPVPTRLEYGEQDKLSAASAFARRAFAPFLLRVQSSSRAIDFDQQAAYWRDVETPYVPYYAFEEIPAAFKDELGGRRGLLAASERLSSWITDREVSSLKFSGKEDRKGVLAAFAFNQDRAAKFDRIVPAGKRRPFAFLETIVYRLLRYRWQAATIVLAVAVGILSWLAVHNASPKPSKNPAPDSTRPEVVTEPSASTHRNNVPTPSPSPRQDSEPTPLKRQ